jgi:hypothetical protein
MFLQPRNYRIIDSGERPARENTEWFEEGVARIIRIMGSDPGVFVLSVHSFVEGYIRAAYGIEESDVNFYDLLQFLAEELKRKKPDRIPGLEILGDLRLAQEATNRVRHRFDSLSTLDAVEAAHRFRRFCGLVGLPVEKHAPQFDEATQLWDRAGDRLSDVKELNEKGFLLLQTRRKSEILEAELQKYRELRMEQADSNQRILQLELALEKAAADKSGSREKIESLRRERFELKEKNRELSTRLNETEHASDYLREMRSLIAYTRTRSDYERSLLKLTKEQLRILDQIDLDHDFLVKGGAGTGKTLILLKALEKSLRGLKTELVTELVFDEVPRTVSLLTYTRTLAKYDNYLAGLMSIADLYSSIDTSEQFLFDRFRRLGLGRIDRDAVASILAGVNTLDFMDNEELKKEIDTFIFGSLVSREEYLEELVPRHGRKTRLSRAQREAVWALADYCMRSMRDGGLFSKQYAALLLSEASPEEDLMVDYCFVDEVQDLSSAELKAIKNHTRRCMILSGDSDQSIYQTVFPLKRSGLNVQGYTRVLRTNFRNTLQIQEFAEKYRALYPDLGRDEETLPEAFRSGPSPELSSHRTRKESLRALISRVDLMINEFFYEPENLCILCPDIGSIREVQRELAEEGYPGYNIRESDFDFNERGVLRLSTLHSAKGLEFPVVLIYLPGLPYVGEGYSEKEREQLQRHLIYVALSRPMDYLHLFLSGDPLPKELEDLRSLVSGDGEE